MNRSLSNKWLLLFLRVALGAIFLAAAVSKIVDAGGFVGTVVGYGLLPDGLARAYGWVVPWVELFVGCALLLGALPRFTAGLTIPLTLSFVVASTYSFLKSPDSTCGCFGSFIVLSHPVSLTIDAVMLAMAGVLVSHRGPEFMSIGQALDKVNPYWRSRVKACYYSSLLVAVVLVMAGTALISFGTKSLTPQLQASLYSQVERSISLPSSLADPVTAAIRDGKPALIHVWIEGCAPCEEARPIIEGLANDYGSQLTYLPINYDEYTDALPGMGVKVTPTVMLIVNETPDGGFGVLATLTNKVEQASLKSAIDAAIEFIR